MAADHVTVSLNGLGAHLNGMAPKQPLDFTRSMTETSVLLASEAKQCFSRGASPDGETWPPLKRRRPGKRNKGKKGLGAKPLYDTGKLMASMLGRGGGAIKDIGPTWCEQGTNVTYAAFHDSDKPRKRGADGKVILPRRQFSGITDAAITKIERFIADDLVRQIAGK